MSVFVVIPAFNEEKNICPVLRDIFSLYPDFKIVVVDDGSSDKTAEMARKCGAFVLDHVINRGQGAALKTGTDFAIKQGAEVIVHFDADRQFEPREISVMIQPVLKGEVEAVLGSRFLKVPEQRHSEQSEESQILRRFASQDDKNIPWSKKNIILPLARVINFLFTGCWLSDAHNGFRAMSRQAATVLDLKQDRMAHNSEIVRMIKENKLSYKECGVTVYYHQYGQGWGGGIKIIKDLIIGKFLK